MRYLEVSILMDDADDAEIARRLRVVADKVERGAKHGNATAEPPTPVGPRLVGAFEVRDSEDWSEQEVARRRSY